VRNPNALPFVAVGGGVVAAALLFRSRQANASGHATRKSHRGEPEMTGSTNWVFPVPSLGKRHAVISDGFGSPRTLPDGTKEAHLGADLMFRRSDVRDLVAVYAPGTVNGTKAHFMPDDLHALAACAGVVRYAKWTTFGFTVVIQHGNGWATYYTHLAALLVEAGNEVSAGQAIGIIGDSPAPGSHIKHLHFELWRDGTRAGVVDPAPYLDAWPRIVIEDWRPSASAAPRNAGFTYRPIGARGEAYPEWVRDLKGKSGVYVIREIDKNGDAETVYVGSSVGRLYNTLTRHFQTWRRWKNFWKGQYDQGHDPGLTYPRDRVEVAVRLTKPDDALDEESRLIRRLRPRDNLLGAVIEEEVPF
jgi:hypothetical protein